MDGQEYLNQISRQIQPGKESRSGILSSKIFLVSAAGAVALVLILIVGLILGGGKGGEKSLTFALKLHLDNTSGVIQTYQPKVKSSNLRSSSASLYSILSNTNRDLTAYVKERYEFKEKNVEKSITKKVAENRERLESELFEAKINGILDRIYAHEMAYEVSAIMSEEEKIINSTKSETLRDTLTTSYNSLENLYTKFSDFSETN